MNALTKWDYQQALLSQGAVNLGAIVRSLNEVMPRIRHDAGDTDAVNRHPIVVLYVTQMMHLSHAEADDTAYYEAHKACEERGRGKNEST